MRVAAAGALLIVTTSCAFDATVPPTTVVRCAADSACPPAFRCASAFGRCVPLGGEDRDAPTLLDATTSKARLTRGDTLRVTLRVSEPLAAPPELRLTQAGRLVSLPLDEPASAPPTYVFTHAVGGADVEGTVRLLVDLLDLAGNQALGLSAGAVTFDFTAPQVLPGSVALQLIGPAGCPLPSVTALRAGAAAQLTFTLDEAPATPPFVAIEGTSLTFENTGRAGTSFVYRLTVDGGPTTGAFPLQLIAQDELGNQENTRLLDGGLTVPFDGTAPPSPPVDLPDQLLYRRAPWGTAEQGSHFTVLAAPGAVEPGLRLRVLDPDTLAELGAAVATDAGATAALSRTDRPVVLVSALDDACNESPARAVRDVDWFATLAGRTPGATYPNPHRALLRRWYANQASPGNAPEPAEGLSLARADGQRWLLSSEKSFSPAIAAAPSPRYGAGFVYDEARRQLLLATGGLPSGFTNQTWTLAGSAWTAHAATAAPTARWHGQLAYDAVRERAVLFGGVTLRGCCNADTLEWDGDEWHLLEPSVTPPGRNNGALIFDAARRVTLLFGGHRGAPPGGGALYDDTWLWDGRTWRRAAAALPAPRARQNHALAYDAARDRVVLFGGMTDAGRAQDTWEWDGLRWSEVDAGSTIPSAREGHALAYDPIRRRTVLFGGDGLADTWEYDGARWIDRTPDAGGPAGRRFHHLAFDPSAARVTLFGGITGATQACAVGCVADLWDWDGSAWTPRSLPSPASGPSGRGELPLAYDPHERRVLLFGGGRPVRNDLWAYDGRAWTALDAGGTAPPPRSNHALVYDEESRALVLHGGASGPTTLVTGESWAYEGGAWRVLAAADAGPGTRTTASAAFDRMHRAVTILGGFTGFGNAGDVWQWRDAGWLAVTAPGLPGGVSRPLTYDDARRQLQLFDGSALLTWDGAPSPGWRRGPALPGPGRGGAVITHDRARGVTLVHGGSTSQATLDELWAWTGADWLDVTPPRPRPDLRQAHGFIYDSARDVGVLFGGLDLGAGQLSDTWELRLEPRFRPAVELQTTFAASNAEADAGVLAITVRAVAGGRGATDGGAVTGAVLALWRDGWFTPVDANDATIDGGAALSADERAPDELGYLLTGRDRLLRVLVTTRGTNGAQPAELAVDSLEVRVRYRRPPD